MVKYAHDDNDDVIRNTSCSVEVVGKEKYNKKKLSERNTVRVRKGREERHLKRNKFEKSFKRAISYFISFLTVLSRL
jgi:hypothetical protein